ncbi:MAG TPA: ATP-binding protein [Gaiellaceae bacterium]|jgi:signal transduction histidine kinase|nr:ATP-binding protein [Gaiellaceae bacterium]
MSDDDLARRTGEAAGRLRAAGDEEAALLLEELLRERTSLHRRLVRLGFDLHDGPLQALVAATADLRYFQQQVVEQLEGHPNAAKLTGRIDDLVARDLALGEQIRALILGTEPDPAGALPLTDAVRDLEDGIGDFELAFELDPRVDELDLSDSQRITLLRVIRAALDNVGLHSEATEATVEVRASPSGGVSALVTDNGVGFDPEAARSSRSIGLVAMRERVRLLGGRFAVESRPGGPTTVRVELPAWLGPAERTTT